jgi:hypothetical protein
MVGAGVTQTTAGIAAGAKPPNSTRLGLLLGLLETVLPSNTLKVASIDPIS